MANQKDVLPEKYDWGYCMYLALALHERTGLQIEATMYDDGRTRYIAHAWVTDGTSAFDAIGTYDVATARVEFNLGADTFLKAMTAAELAAECIHGVDEADLCEAREWVSKTLADHPGHWVFKSDTALKMRPQPSVGRPTVPRLI